MELLIDIDSGPSEGNSKSNMPSSTDLLLEGSDNGEAVLRGCPVLAADAYSLLTMPVQPQTTAHRQETSRHASGICGVPTARNMVDNRGQVQIHRANQTSPHEQLATTSTQSVTQTGAIVLNASRNASDSAHTSQEVQANLIISHAPDLASGVIEAAYKELDRASSNGKVELCRTYKGSYVKMIAPTKNITQLISAAQDVAEDFMYNEPIQGPGVFQEPPAHVNSTSWVVLDIDPSTGDVRPKLQSGQGAVTSLQFPETTQEYTSRLSNRVYKALKKAGRLPLSLTLRVHLGQCMLRTYPLGKKAYGYHDFHAMMKNPRASTWFKTSLGDETLARKVLDFVRNTPESPFEPTSGRITSLAHVLPEYALELHSQQTKFDVPIKKRTGGISRGAATCQLYQVTASPVEINSAELDIINLSLGKNLDWKIESVNEDKGAKTYPDVTQYLRSGTAKLPNTNQPHDFNVYPRVELDRVSSIEAKIRHVVVKTIYQFRWKATSYIVQISINRRWSSISAMTAEKVPTTDFGISILGETWDNEDDVTGNIWGDELQHLLGGRTASVTAKGIDRVIDFLQVMRDIRDTIGPLF